MARLTWKNVAAPDFSSSIEGTVRAGDMIARGLSGFSNYIDNRIKMDADEEFNDLRMKGMEQDQQLAALKLQEAQANFAKYGSTVAPKRTGGSGGGSTAKSKAGDTVIGDLVAKPQGNTDAPSSGGLGMQVAPNAPLNLGETVSTSSPTLAKPDVTKNGNRLGFGSAVPQSPSSAVPAALAAPISNVSASPITRGDGTSITSSFVTPTTNTSSYGGLPVDTSSLSGVDLSTLTLDQGKKFTGIAYEAEGANNRAIQGVGYGIDNAKAMIELAGAQRQEVVDQRKFNDTEYDYLVRNGSVNVGGQQLPMLDLLRNVGLTNFSNKQDFIEAIRQEDLDILGDISEKDKKIYLDMVEGIDDSNWAVTPGYGSVLLDPNNDVNMFDQGLAAYRAGESMDLANNIGASLLRTARDAAAEFGSTNPKDALYAWANRTQLGDDGETQVKLVRDSAGELDKTFNRLQERFPYVPPAMISAAMMRNTQSANSAVMSVEKIGVDIGAAAAELSAIDSKTDFEALASDEVRRENEAAQLAAMEAQAAQYRNAIAYWEENPGNVNPEVASAKLAEALAAMNDLNFEFGMMADPENTMRPYATTPAGTGGGRRALDSRRAQAGPVSTMDAQAVMSSNIANSGEVAPSSMPTTRGTPLSIGAFDTSVNKLLPQTYGMTQNPRNASAQVNQLPPRASNFGFDIDAQAEVFRQKQLQSVAPKVQTVLSSANNNTLTKKDWNRTLSEVKELAEDYPNDPTIAAYLKELLAVGAKF